MRSMKTYKPLQLILLSLTFLSLSGCMPDSFTKFNEDPPVSSQGAGAAPAPTPTPPPVTAPSDCSYNESKVGDRIVNLPVGSTLDPGDIVVHAITGFIDNYSISPALPAGMSLNSITGEISGTPAVYTPETTYIVTASNAAGSTGCTIIMTNLNAPTGLRVEGQPKVVLTVVSAAPFFVGGQISSAGGGVATIEQIEGNRIIAQVTAGSFTEVAPNNDVDPGPVYLAPATTVIDEVNYTINQKVKVASSAGFIPGSLIGSSLGHYGVVLETVSATEFTIGILSGSFNEGDSLDDTYPYAAEADVVQEISFIYGPGEEIDLRPVLATGEEYQFKILPDEVLPEAFDGFNQDFGYVQGSQNGSDLYTFTLQVENAVGTDITTFAVGPEESAPQNMNFSQTLLLNVGSTAAFQVGDEVSSDDPGAGGGGGSATVLKVIDATNLYVFLHYGFFNTGEAIDNVFPFGGEKTFVNSALPVNAVLHVGDGQGASFGRKGFISAVGNAARGLVAHVDPSDVTEDVIYAFTYEGSFVVGDATPLTVDDEENYLAAAATVSNIEATNLRLRVNSVASFEKGSQITDAAGSAGHVMDIDSTNLDLYVEVNNQGFDYNNAVDDIDNFNPYAAVATDITQVSPDNTFYLYRNVRTRLNAFLRKGSSPIWTISPALPEGLELDVDYGHITGTPTKSSSKKVYVVTATNLIDGNVNTETFTFSMQVLDHFTITNETPGATSYILHKEGRKNGSSQCTITRDQILGSDQSVKDIVCRLEGEEQDLVQHGLTIQINSSAGLCQFVKHSPYTFNVRSVTPTTAHTVVHVNGLANGADCVPPGMDTPAGGPTETPCNSNYTQRVGMPYNCDTGGYVLRQILWSGGATGLPCTIAVADSDTLTTCDGNPRLCRDGALKGMEIGLGNVFNHQDFDSVSTASSEGLLQNYAYKSPMEDTDFGSIKKLVNYVGNNSCAEASAGTAQGYLYGALNWDLYPTAGTSVTPAIPVGSPPETVGAFIGTIDFPAQTAASSQVDRSTISTPADYTGSIKPGDFIAIAWGSQGGIGKHKVLSISATQIVFMNGLDFRYSVGGALYDGPYNLYYDLHTDPFKGNFTNPYYVYECKDAADDTIARIRLQVREWDRNFNETSDIDILSQAATGTVSTSVGTNALTGAGTLFSTELQVNQMFRVGNQVNYVTVINNDTSLDMRDNSPATIVGQTLYSRPLLMDAGDSIDLFLQFYNDYPDWDDRNSSIDPTSFRGRFPYKNSCDVGAPISDPASRDYFYDFQDAFLKI